jgi:hypothetical protein
MDESFRLDWWMLRFLYEFAEPVDATRHIDLREGDLLETLKDNVPILDFVLLDSTAWAWAACASLTVSSLGPGSLAGFEDPRAKNETRYGYCH